jgi:hypothetical protein
VETSRVPGYLRYYFYLKMALQRTASGETTEDNIRFGEAPGNIPDLTSWLATSLTSRADLRKKMFMIKDTASIPLLTDDQVKLAIVELINDDLVKNYPSLEKSLVDPDIYGQEFCVHSFTPSSGATPDSNGVYGMMKCRGTFSKEMDATIHSETLIRSVDSFNKYFIGYVGKPFPVTTTGIGFSSESDKIDLREKVDLKDSIQRNARENILSERAKEKVTTKNIKERSEALQDVVDEDAEDPYTEYIQTRVKRSHLIYTIVESRKKIQNYLKSVKTNDMWLNTKDAEDPDFKKNFMEKYTEARKSSGVPDSDLAVMMYIDDVTPPNFWDGYIDDEEEVVDEEVVEDIEDSKVIVTEADGEIIEETHTKKAIDAEFSDLNEV